MKRNNKFFSIPVDGRLSIQKTEAHGTLFLELAWE